MKIRSHNFDWPAVGANWNVIITTVENIRIKHKKNMYTKNKCTNRATRTDWWTEIKIQTESDKSLRLLLLLPLCRMYVRNTNAKLRDSKEIVFSVLLIKNFRIAKQIYFFIFYSEICASLKHILRQCELESGASIWWRDVIIIIFIFIPNKRPNCLCAWLLQQSGSEH